jgi:hypothetical protein
LCRFTTDIKTYKVPKPYITPSTIVDKDPSADKKSFHYVYVIVKNDPIPIAAKETKEENNGY